MHHRICSTALILLSTWTAVSATADPQSGAAALVDPTPKMVSKSLLSSGNTARLQNVMRKARQGRKIVIGAIGGSITEGALASTPEKRWANLAAKWWTDRFPQTEIQFVNAGIGATGSNFGAHRVQDHLLKYKPDLVIAEYAVNDANTQLAAETLEGLTRQVLKMPNKPAMMLLFTMTPDGGNAQEWHSKIGYHYGLPMISFRDALLPEFKSERIKSQAILPDAIHPNDQGHMYIGEFIGAFLDKVYASLPPDVALPRIKRLPKPLISDVFEYTAMLNRNTIKPVRNDGWSPIEVSRYGNCWESGTPGSQIEFDVEGDTISMMYYRIKGDMGIVNAQVDNNPPVKLNAWFEADWGGYPNWELLARNLGPGRHRLKITLLHEKAPQSTGHKFQIFSIMEAGLKHQ